jgi:hypothetical protein
MRKTLFYFLSVQEDFLTLGVSVFFGFRFLDLIPSFFFDGGRLI